DDQLKLFIDIASFFIFSHPRQPIIETSATIEFGFVQYIKIKIQKSKLAVLPVGNIIIASIHPDVPKIGMQQQSTFLIINIYAVRFLGIDAVTAVIERYLGVIQRNDFLPIPAYDRSEEHTSELQSRENLVCRLL